MADNSTLIERLATVIERGYWVAFGKNDDDEAGAYGCEIIGDREQVYRSDADSLEAAIAMAVTLCLVHSRDNGRQPVCQQV